MHVFKKIWGKKKSVRQIIDYVAYITSEDRLLVEEHTNPNTLYSVYIFGMMDGPGTV